MAKFLQTLIPEAAPGWRRWLLHAGCGAPDLLALLAGLLIRVLLGRRTVVAFGAVWVELRDGWFTRGPYKNWGATTLGHVVMVRPGDLAWADADVADWVRVAARPLGQIRDPRDWRLAFSLGLAGHELTHVEVYEALAWVNLAGVAAHAALSGGTGFAVAVTQWAVGGFAAFGAAMFVAWLRGESSAYRGSTFEEAARNHVSCYGNPDGPAHGG